MHVVLIPGTPVASTLDQRRLQEYYPMENDPQTRDERARCQALDRAVGNAARSGSSGDTDQIVADARLFHAFLMGTEHPAAINKVTSNVSVPTTLSERVRRMGHPHPDDRD